MSIIVFLFSVILCHTVSEGKLKVPFLKRDMEVGQTLEEASEEVGNRRRWFSILPWLLYKRYKTESFRDCKLYRRRDRPEVYLFLDGQCRHIPDPHTLLQLFTSWSAVRVIHPWSWPHCNKGPSISRGAFLGQAHAIPKVYLFSNGVKRHIWSPKTMSKCNFNWGRIRLVSTHHVVNTPTSFIIK